MPLTQSTPRARVRAGWILLGAIAFALLGAAAGRRLSFQAEERAILRGPHFVATWAAAIEPQRRPGQATPAGRLAGVSRPADAAPGDAAERANAPVRTDA